MTTNNELIEQAALEVIEASAIERAGVIEKYLDIGEEASGGEYNIHEEALFFGIVDQALRIVKKSSEAELLALAKLIDKQCRGEWSFFHIRDILKSSIDEKYFESMNGIITYLEEPLNQDDRNKQKKKFLDAMDSFNG